MFYNKKRRVRLSMSTSFYFLKLMSSEFLAELITSYYLFFFNPL